MAAESPQASLAHDAAIQRTVEALKSRNIDTRVAENGEAALEMLKELIPPGAELFTSTSETLDAIGYTEYLHHTDRYRDLHQAIVDEPDVTKQREMRRLASVAEYVVGSVQAIAETGEVLIASGSGSQLGAYAYGAKHLIWVAGTQKICPTLSDAIERVRGYTVERHDQWLVSRGRSASPLGKLLIFENEQNRDRVKMILVKQSLGW